MELLESDDPTKGQLLKRSALHREQLEEDVKLVSERTQKIITNALIIGGSLALTYFVISRFSGSKPKAKRKAAKIKLVQSAPQDEAEEVIQEAGAPGIASQIGTAIASQATAILLSLAKEKLMEFMQAQADKKNQ